VSGWVLADCLIDFFFLADVALNFNTGRMSRPDEAVDMDRCHVTWGYLPDPSLPRRIPLHALFDVGHGLMSE
jgi:hypothetical protein